MKIDDKVSDYINAAPSGQIVILETLRQLINDTVPDTNEALKWGMPVFSKSKSFSYLKSNKHHVTMGFYQIDRISDPRGLLEGTGKTMRHLKIKAVDDINAEIIAQWLKATAE